MEEKEEADGCDQPGEIEVRRRREGLYSSHLTTWRRQRQMKQLAGMATGGFLHILRSGLFQTNLPLSCPKKSWAI